MHYVGEMVHLDWRGVCNPAVITDLWDEEGAKVARLTAFERGSQVIHGRSKAGKKGDDETFHSISECPDVNLAAKVATPPDPNADPDSGPDAVIAASNAKPAAKPKRAARKPK